MDIVFYNNRSENNKIGKMLSQQTTLSGAFRDASNVISPRVTIEAGNLDGLNYAYIAQFGRYYFITEKTALRTNLWDVQLSVDVLESFKNQILNLTGIIDKQENEYTNLYLDDGSFVMENKMANQIYNFPNGFNDNGEFILIVAGA